MSKNEVEFKTLVHRDEAVAHLEKLVECLKAGRIVMEKGKHFVSVAPGENMVLEMECSQKKEKEKVSFELSWNPQPPPAPKEQVTISFNEPRVRSVEEREASPEHHENIDIK
jgi:amphi-Trp domain-containing protein